MTSLQLLSAKIIGIQLTHADGVVAKDLVASSPSGTRMYSILASNTDIIDHEIQIMWSDGVLDVPLSTVMIPASSGNVVDRPLKDLIDLLPTTWKLQDETGTSYILLPQPAVGVTSKLKIRSLTALPNTKMIGITSHIFAI